MEFATTERQKQIFKFVLNAQTLGRPFAAPAGIPADAAVGFAAGPSTRAMADPALLAEMKARKLDVDHIGWRTIGALLGDLYATPKSVVTETRAITSEE